MKDRSFGSFSLHPLGYVQHWLITGPRSIPYTGSIKDDDSYRRDAVDSSRVEPPKLAELGYQGPLGPQWRFHYSGRNYFVEFSDFWSAPSIVDLYASTCLDVKESSELPMRLWAAGSVDLWINGAHKTRFDCPRYMQPDYQLMTIPLSRGSNQICVRLQVAAIRDTRLLFGLQLLGSPPIEVRVPAAASFREPIEWFDQVKTAGLDHAVCRLPAPAGADVVFSDGRSLAWPMGEKQVSFGTTRPYRFAVRIACGGQSFERHFEIPANRNGLPDGLPADLRQAHLEYIASAPDDGFFPGVNYGQLPLLARRVLGRTSPIDPNCFATLIQYIKDRKDCSDFALATLLRLVRLGLATAEETAEIKQAALGFRYWTDEPGADAMCFGSENHSLLFHGCQFMAGQMYPDEVFSNAERTGREHSTLGLQRASKWLGDIEERGLGEFLSSTYVPLTMGALLNVIDFSGEPSLSQRASALLDRLYEDLADHAFRGLTVGPQGRVYRNVLYPEEGGTQALLSWATSMALPDLSRRDSLSKERTGDWMVFLATSKCYRSPNGLAERMRSPVSRRYSQSGVEIVLHKTPDYILTSLAVPRCEGQAGLRPGAAGYQEHLWQATLGVGCHIFVNHPGCSLDVEKLSRPGYWYGNGVLPVVRQHEGVLRTIFNIPDGAKSSHANASEEKNGSQPTPRLFDIHPIPFTHAHWPSDAFERQESHGNWVFGWKQSGFIGLWCSEPLEPHDDILSGRELRAPGYRSACVVICGGLSTDPSFAAFIEPCEARNPEFDRDQLILRMKGEQPLCWPAPKDGAFTI